MLFLMRMVKFGAIWPRNWLRKQSGWVRAQGLVAVPPPQSGAQVEEGEGGVGTPDRGPVFHWTPAGHLAGPGGPVVVGHAAPGAHACGAGG